MPQKRELNPKRKGGARKSTVVEPDLFVVDAVDYDRMSLPGTAVGEVVHAVRVMTLCTSMSRMISCC